MLETEIYTALSGDTGVSHEVGDRIYPIVMPQKPVLPAVTYQRTSSEKINDLDGYCDLEKVHIMINAWGLTYDVVKRISVAIHNAINVEQTKFRAILVNRLDGYDPDTGLYVVSQDFACWYHRTERIGIIEEWGPREDWPDEEIWGRGVAL